MERFLSVALHVTYSSVLFALGLSCIVLIAGSQDTMNQYVDEGTVYLQESEDFRYFHGSLLFYILEYWLPQEIAPSSPPAFFRSSLVFWLCSAVHTRLLYDCYRGCHCALKHLYGCVRNALFDDQLLHPQ
jgi:hypothetical protein